MLGFLGEGMKKKAGYVCSFATHRYTLMTVGALSIFGVGVGVGAGYISLEIFWNTIAFGMSIAAPHYRRIIDVVNLGWQWCVARPLALVGIGLVSGGGVVAFLYNRYTGKLRQQLLNSENQVNNLMAQLGQQGANHALAHNHLAVAPQNNPQTTIAAQLNALKTELKAEQKEKIDELQDDLNALKNEVKKQFADQDEKYEELGKKFTELDGLQKHGLFSQPKQPAGAKAANDDEESFDGEYRPYFNSPV